MGNSIDSRAIVEGGFLYVKTDKPFYYPGNTVYGKIYIRCDVPIEAKYLEIKIEGKEKASFYREETHRRGEETYTTKEKTKTDKKIFNYRATAFEF